MQIELRELAARSPFLQVEPKQSPRASSLTPGLFRAFITPSRPLMESLSIRAQRVAYPQMGAVQSA